MSPRVNTATADNGNLDLLRSVAVLLVLGFHVALVSTNRHIPHSPLDLHQAGRWGVLLFFVHTSYVLMLSQQRHASDGAGGDAMAFFARRAFRLLPLSVLTVAVVTLFGWPVADFPFRSVDRTLVSTLSNLLLVQNLTHVDSTVATLWSLPYEVQMYLVLPVLFAFSRRFTSTAAMLVVWVICAIGAMWWLPRLGGFYDMPLYIPCFLGGVIGYQRLASVRPSLSHRWWAVWIAAVSIGFLAHPSTSAGWVACLAIGASIPAFSPWPEGWFREAARFTAKYSYGIYLSHWVALWVAAQSLANYGIAVRSMAFLGLTAALSIGLYHALEAPMIAVGNRVAKRLAGRRRSVVPAALAGVA